MTTSIALIGAHASHLAYLEGSELELGIIDNGFLSSRRITVRNHSVTIFQHRLGLFVAFRGSCGGRDWRFNLMAIPVRRSWGWVHMGFAKAAEALWPQIASRIATASASGQKIYFTGHSLGGAMAVVSALKAHDELNVPTAGLFTFGQPPLASKSTLASIQKAGIGPYLRFVGNVDVVATGPLLPYFHSGEVRYFDCDKQLHQSMSWLRFMKDAIVIGYRSRRATGQITAHYMRRYLPLMEQHAASFERGQPS